MKCHLCWESSTMLLIGWADFVKIAQVKERPARDGMQAAKLLHQRSRAHGREPGDPGIHHRGGGQVEGTGQERESGKGVEMR
eukprot:768466-Hanusia_phi.AAC.6